jgi:aminoglycoside phosphotransferase (APT) family kinase protein
MGYFHVVRSLRQTVCDNLSQPWVTTTRRATLSRLLRVLECLERNWMRLDAVCTLAPQTLVHGDLVQRNVRIRNGEASFRELVVLDWEMAGAGVPSIDLSSIPCDLTHYVRSMHCVWPDVSLATVERLARVGDVFRSLAALEWLASSLHHEWSLMTGLENAERWLQESVCGVETADWM